MVLLLALGLKSSAQTQDTVPSVEKSIFNAQVGYLGIWGSNEAKLSNHVALRSEIGFNAGMWGGFIYPKTGYVLIPTITLAPRFYYNLQKRVKKGKSIANNSGNFISLRSTFMPNWFVISNYNQQDFNLFNSISLVPTWGIRRHIGKHINYEAGLGAGLRYFFAKPAGYPKNELHTELNLHLKIGYTF